jgi:hypothetical protein
MLFLTLLFAPIVLLFYKRYFPVYGVRRLGFNELFFDNVGVIDLRDFNESYMVPVENAINIPLAYLKRNIHEIPNKDLHIIATNQLDRNIGICELRQRGFQVIGYTIMQQNISWDIKQTSLSSRKG